MTLPSTPSDRTYRDLYLEERRLRDLAESQLAAHRDLARHVAARFAAHALDEVCRANPRALERFTPEEWRAFFDQAAPRSGWGQTPADREAQLERMAAERDAARAQLAQAVQAHLSERQARTEAEARLASLARRVDYHTRKTTTPTTSKAVERNQRLTAQSVEVEWPALPPVPPTGWERQITVPIERWQLMALHLWLIAVRGWPLFQEGERLLLRRDPAMQSRLRKTRDDLLRARLVQAQTYPDILPRDAEGGPATTSVHVAVLTPTGRALCEALGWGGALVDSEWVRFTRANLSESSIAAGLLFAAECRRRQCHVEAHPDSLNGLGADVRVTDPAGTPVDVLIEPATQPQRLERWQALASQSQPLAFCAATPSQRAALVAVARELRLAGQATDVQTLSAARGLGLLWAETWA